MGALGEQRDVLADNRSRHTCPANAEFAADSGRGLRLRIERLELAWRSPAKDQNAGIGRRPGARRRGGFLKMKQRRQGQAHATESTSAQEVPTLDSIAKTNRRSRDPNHRSE